MKINYLHIQYGFLLCNFNLFFLPFCGVIESGCPGFHILIIPSSPPVISNSSYKKINFCHIPANNHSLLLKRGRIGSGQAISIIATSY